METACSASFSYPCDDNRDSTLFAIGERRVEITPLHRRGVSMNGQMKRFRFYVLRIEVDVAARLPVIRGSIDICLEFLKNLPRIPDVDHRQGIQSFSAYRFAYFWFKKIKGFGKRMQSLCGESFREVVFPGLPLIRRPIDPSLGIVDDAAKSVNLPERPYLPRPLFGFR